VNVKYFQMKKMNFAQETEAQTLLSLQKCYSWQLTLEKITISMIEENKLEQID
jgi:hypothetical protein